MNAKKKPQRRSRATNLYLRPNLVEWARDHAQNSDRFKNLSDLVGHLLSDYREMVEGQRKTVVAAMIADARRAEDAGRVEPKRTRARG